MGLGKTVQTLALLAWLMEARQNQGPFLIIVPMSTLNNNWEYEINRWMPNVQKILYHGARDRRREIRETQLNGGNYNILLTTYEFAMRDKKFLNKIAWQYIIVDEAHRLKNPKCKLATELVTYNQKSRRVALTGTPLQNDLPELWALLNFLHPSIFDNVSSFEKWFANPLGDALGLNKKDNEENIQMTEEEKLLVADRLHQVLRPFMLRREKSQVECELQDKLEVVLRCDLTKTQEIFYECLMTQRVHMANQMVQLRKVCNHPFLFHPYMRNVPGSFLYDNEMLVKLSGKFALLDRVLPKLKATNHRVLIFNQMTKVMNILEHYMNHRGYSFVRLDGSTAAAERQERLTQFNTNRSIFVFMLSTKAGNIVFLYLRTYSCLYNRRARAQPPNCRHRHFVRLGLEPAKRPAS
jgi:SNF2 family DNA or RNA helicase